MRPNDQISRDKRRQFNSAEVAAYADASASRMQVAFQECTLATAPLFAAWLRDEYHILQAIVPVREYPARGDFFPFLPCVLL